jgi:hypothetical protein
LALLAEVRRLVEKWGEPAVVNAVEAARTPRPRGPKPMADHLHLLEVVGIMLLSAFEKKSMDSAEAVRIHVKNLGINKSKQRNAVTKRLRRKVTENWFGFLFIFSVLYDACVIGELREGHKLYLAHALKNWWSLRKLSNDPAEISKFWGPDDSDRFKAYFLAPFGESRFSVYHH